MAWRGWGSEPLFLGHFWSLAVEEQFYLIWPAGVLMMGREHLIRSCVAGILAAFVVRLALLRFFTYESAYTLLPARMDALLVGAAVALLLRRDNGLPLWMTPKILLAAIWLIFALDLGLGETLLTGSTFVLRTALHFSVESFAFGALLVAALTGTRGSLLIRVFRSRVLRFFGKYSYAIYIFHLAVIVALPKIISVVSIRVLGRSTAPGVVVFGMIALALCVSAALVSWSVVEKPALALKERLVFGPRPGVAEPGF